MPPAAATATTEEPPAADADRQSVSSSSEESDIDLEELWPRETQDQLQYEVRGDWWALDGCVIGYDGMRLPQ